MLLVRGRDNYVSVEEWRAWKCTCVYVNLWNDDSKTGSLFHTVNVAKCMWKKNYIFQNNFKGIKAKM